MIKIPINDKKNEFLDVFYDINNINRILNRILSLILLKESDFISIII